MANRPAFAPSDAFPASYGDALAVVLEADRDMRAAAARKAIGLIEAHRQQGRPNRFENRMLANRSFRAEVAALLNITEKAAENLIGYSEALADAFPKTLESLKAGTITWQHATVIVDELGGVRKPSRELIESLALGEAPHVTANRLARIVRFARETSNPETIPEKQEVARRLRGVGVVDGRDGMSTMFITAQSVQIHAAFNRLTVGAKAMDAPLETRTLDQRRADIVTHILLADVEGAAFGVVPDEWDDENFTRWFRGITPTVVVSVPVLTLLGQSDEPAILDGWVPIDPATARVLAGRAKSFIRILTHPETGVVLSVGRRRYKVPKDLRTYLEIRDLTCRFPGCELAAWRTDIDHIFEWQFGGETCAMNLGCLCRGHHTLKTAGFWTATRATDGSEATTWTDRTGRSYITRPHNPMAA